MLHSSSPNITYRFLIRSVDSLQVFKLKQKTFTIHVTVRYQDYVICTPMVFPHNSDISMTRTSMVRLPWLIRTPYESSDSWRKQIQSNLNSWNTDGSFTMANSNSVLSPYWILPIDQENKYLRKLSFFHYEIVCCVYSLELPLRGDSNEYT